MRAQLLSLSVFAAALFAQSQQAPSQLLFPLEHLTVTGAERLPPERILAVAGLKIGQRVNKAVFDDARERLLATGGFETIGYQYKPSADYHGFDASFEVHEVLQMYPYRFEDLPTPDAALRALIHQREPIFEDEIPVTQEVIARIARVLSTAAAVPVEGHLAYTKTGEGEIVFRPPGEAPHIYEVHFSGNDAVPAEQLNRKFILVAFGAEYTETQVRALLESSIRPLYEAKGRLRVTFPKITAEPAKAPEVVGVSVSIEILEGPEYKLGAVKLTGIPAKQIKQIETLADFKKNETANFDAVDKALERIRKHYWADGYLHAKVTADRNVNDQDHLVDLAVKVETGPQFTYGKLNIQGLDILNEPPIRKLWGPREGRPFDPTSPDAFLKLIREDGLFDNLAETQSQTKLNEETHTADVTLIFKGGPEQNVRERRNRGASP